MEETFARRRGREEGGVVILDESDEEAPTPSNLVLLGDPGQGCSKDSGGAGDDGDCTNFYKLLGILDYAVMPSCHACHRATEPLDVGLTKKEQKGKTLNK
ncbi:Cysteine-rich receptor-like protein kinase 10 [Hordeum vulgare]|nr:Cysteine-rich receptor-like protein kinase 10 [Hordeum vulgare]